MVIYCYLTVRSNSPCRFRFMFSVTSRCGGREMEYRNIGHGQSPPPNRAFSTFPDVTGQRHGDVEPPMHRGQQKATVVIYVVHVSVYLKKQRNPL